MFSHAVNEAIIGIRALVVALNPLKPRVFGDPQRQSVLGAQLLQFCEDAVRDDGGALGKETVHHARDNVEFLLDRV